MTETMVHTECSAILFDMDGVLIDSTPAVARVWRGWAVEHGLDPEEVIRRAHGRPSIETIRHYLPGADHASLNREIELQEMEDLEGVVALPGSQALLRSLPLRRWTIVTSATRRLAEVRLRKAGLPIPANLITASDISHGKPHPEPYLTAASVLGFPATACIVIEDVPAGIQSGKAAGARVIGFPTTVPAAALIAAGADWVAKDCSEIAASRGLALSFRNRR